MTSTQTYAIVAAVAVVLLLAIAYAYEECKFGLNKHLPAKWQKTCPHAASGFVGAYGRAPGMEGCNVWSGFNRCTYA